MELQELEIQICEKKIKEAKELIEAKKVEIGQIDELINGRNEDLNGKKGELDAILADSAEEEKRLMADREKATKKIEDKLLKYYER